MYFEDLRDVEIPVDGTLSQVIFKNERLRVVRFAFDKGQELTEHTASRPVVIEAISGEFDLTFGGSDVVIGPGSWTYLEANLPHSVKARQPSVLLLTLLG